MPITDEEYRKRETFLLEVQALQRQTHEAIEQVQALGSDGDPPPIVTRLRSRLNRIRQQLRSVAGAYNRNGVTQGSLHPPTATHRELVARLAQSLEAALLELRELLETRRTGPAF